MTTCIALLRGINVGRAKRIAMADLRALVVELGFSNVSTVLNSGNVIFQSTRLTVTEAAAAIERTMAARFGFSAPVIVLSADALRSVVKESPLSLAVEDPSRYLVAFVANPATLAKAKPMLAVSWSPEAIVLGSKAAYLWCPNGFIESKIAKEFARLTGEAATTRNWTTVLRLQAAAQPNERAS